MPEPLKIEPDKPLPTDIDWDNVSEVQIYRHSLADMEVRMLLTEATKHHKKFQGMNAAAINAMDHFVT